MFIAPEQWNNASVKTIGIDCRFGGTRSGLGRYTRAMLTELLRSNHPVQYVLFVGSEKEEWLQNLRHVANCKLQIANFAHYSLAEQTLFPALLWRSGIDLFFSPHFNVPLLCPVPFVSTIHDLILHRYPGNASLLKRLAYRLQMASTIRRTKAILAVSSFTALEIGGIYGSRAHRKCHVTGEGVEEQFFPASVSSVAAIRTRYRLEKPFFLYVGSGKKHKNVRMLIDTFAALQNTDQQLVLVMLASEAPHPLPPDVIHIPDVADVDLPALYCAADCFVTASLYEGYCLPVAEALSCGCPVIACNRTAIPEIASGHAMLIEPTLEAWKQAMRNPPQRPVHYRQPLWKDAAEKTAKVLIECL
ncbi:hypothetical protein A3C37_00170 [Candidatus Peribacteria bacterium RIFCSPHIGHO2_02_FULL_53_20]|nr:MAG: hypothetical protein A3C37_00170 [Candidatus Peribacteria bacterium RIFCSPHIGHO2_02_FULL_53_20]OGJ69619.1 MAG: hypothetical protein A3G69_01455 [Candidatus Peribacteria bacterium RIFCSPLOWO2_12_FULL_53_10]